MSISFVTVATTSEAYVRGGIGEVNVNDYTAALETLGARPVSPEWSPSGVRAVQVPMYFVRFKPWTQLLQDDTHRKSKSVIELEGKEQYAELAILQALQGDGWSGRWIDSWF